MAKSRANAASFRAAMRLFELLGHPTRLIVFQRIARTPMTAGELAKGLPVSRTAAVQHLKVLEAAGLADATPEGRRRIYRSRAGGLAPLGRWLDLHGDG
jgi:DNA-binding transcriptional ArsR family regulator